MCVGGGGNYPLGRCLELSGAKNVKAFKEMKKKSTLAMFNLFNPKKDLERNSGKTYCL